jgi:agmatine deiminase
MARFVGKDRVVVPRYVDPSAADAGVYDESADILEAAGLDVVRMDVPGAFVHRGVSMSAVYVNWLVLDEVVVATGFGEPAWDLDARAFIEGVFPGREVLMVETRDLWYFGGGVHCVTNDQPGI